MQKSIDIAVLVGSLRKASLNRMMAHALIALASAPLTLEIVEIGHLPLYNEDSEDQPPAAWTQFRERIRRADAVLFVTPEYNRSVPAALKNALDVGSRPYGRAPGLENRVPSSVCRLAPSAASAPIIIYGSHLYS